MPSTNAVSLRNHPQELNMSKPHIAATTPFAIDVEKGKDYYWCACGLSKSQPFCDGSHKGTEFTPAKWVAEKDGKAFFCGCKHSKTPQLCDGSHKTL